MNAYFYMHGYVWLDAPPHGIPDGNPGTLLHANTPVPPPGNRVRSYLDIVAPDGASWPEIQSGLLAFVAASRHTSMPWERVVQRCLFRVGMEESLAAHWQRELAVLYGAAQSARIGG